MKTDKVWAWFQGEDLGDDEHADRWLWLLEAIEQDHATTHDQAVGFLKRAIVGWSKSIEHIKKCQAALKLASERVEDSSIENAIKGCDPLVALFNELVREEQDRILREGGEALPQFGDMS